MNTTALAVPKEAPTIESVSLPPVFERPLPSPAGYPQRAEVPLSARAWERELPHYNPPFYESPKLAVNDRTKKPGGWADPADMSRAELLRLSASREMRSYEGAIRHDPATGHPLNPTGRTGIKGRGLLGKWGPNHAADPIVTRVSPETGHLEILLIQRRCGSWAIPGGMVDPGEEPLATARRELAEETGVSLDDTAGAIVYQGTSHDPRSTDNAWIETTAIHFHLSDSSPARSALPKESSDAVDAKWMTVTPDLIRSLYANHGELVSMALNQWRLTQRKLSGEIALQLGEIEHIPLLTNLAHLSGRIGIFGGSFDPITTSHIESAKKVAEWHNLDAVVFMPTGQNPLKASATVALPCERVEMAYHALRAEPRLFVCPLEARKGAKVGYTVDMLREINAEIDPQQCKLFLILGADCLRDIGRWKEHREIPRLAEILPIARTGESDVINDADLLELMKRDLGAAETEKIVSKLVGGLAHAGSATMAREQLRQGIATTLITPSVARFIRERGLYTNV